MGPGGYRFGDYWRMGLLLEAIVIVTAIPLILLFWPLAR
jgi:di/tricarboxylate transporter